MITQQIPKIAYRRGASRLEFYHSTVGGKTIYSGESPAIVCHELGHAVLDAIRPQLFNAASIEAAAFHESFGDMSAILSALQLNSIAQSVLTETGGRLFRSTFLSRMAEQLGWAIRQINAQAVEPDCLRNAVNSFFIAIQLHFQQQLQPQLFQQRPTHFRVSSPRLFMMRLREC